MAKKNENLKPLPREASVKGYNPKGDERKVYDQFLRRKQELLTSRNNVYGLNIDAEMRRMDKLYFRKFADIPPSELDANSKPLAINGAYGKIQTALGILIDNPPKYILEEDNPKYSANKELLKQLAQKSFRDTNSLGQLKLSIFNAAKRGWGAGRTFNRQLLHDGKFLDSIDAKGNRAYTTKKVVKMDDIAYMNMNNFNVWFDEQTKPEDFFSTRDWMWREVWYIDDLKTTFPKSEFPNMEFVHSGGDTRESIEGIYTYQVGEGQGTSPQAQKPGMTEVFFYENQYADQFIIEMNGVMVVWEPLPQNNKRISGVYFPWHLRGDDTIYGIGVVEEMENNEELIDRIVNMDMRQLLLTISPPGFYSGTEDFEDENIKIIPGVLRRTMNPKDINFLQIPVGNSSGIDKINWLKTQQDGNTGITPTIEGAAPLSSSTTAFQIGVEREAGLKRLRLPLKSIQYGLDWEFQNRVALIQQTYADFQVEHLADQESINAYLDEVGADPEFYFIENEGEAGQEVFYAKKYRGQMLNLEQGEDGTFTESDSKSFFHIKPEYLAFTGWMSTDISSLLTTSDELEKADTLRMTNMLIPILQLPKEIGAKPAKQMLLSANKEPKKWLPQEWLDFLAGTTQPNTAAKKESVPTEDMGMIQNTPPETPKTPVPPGETEKGPGGGFAGTFIT